MIETIATIFVIVGVAALPVIAFGLFVDAIFGIAEKRERGED